MPPWALTIAFWLHMVATVVWIGGLFYHAAVLLPALQQRWPHEDQARLLDRLRRRFDPLAWLSLAVLVASGLVQMAANPQYQGFLSIENRWSAAILIKHIAIGGMVIAAVYQTWSLQPALERALLMITQARGEASPAAPLILRLKALVRLNFGLGLLVLALTAIARTA